MPHVFSLAQANSSTIRNRKDEQGTASCEIMWKVDWNFESAGKVLSDTCVSETKTVEELLSRFFADTWKLGPTRQFFTDPEASASTMDVFLINYQKQEVRLDPTLPLRDALRDQAILEYPSLIVRPRVVVVDSPAVSPSV